MKNYIVAGLIVIGLTTPAFAKTLYYVVMDTVHNCSVVEAKPSASLKVLKGGLSSEDAAKKALANMGKQCHGIVQ